MSNLCISRLIEERNKLKKGTFNINIENKIYNKCKFTKKKN